jgi:hypothetical protein
MEATLEAISDKASFWQLFRLLCAPDQSLKNHPHNGQSNLFVRYKENAIINFGKILVPGKRVDDN